MERGRGRIRCVWLLSRFLCDILFPSQHALLETEAENVRSSILNAVLHIKSFGEEVTESARRLQGVIQQIEGGVRVIPSPDGSTTAQQVSVDIRWLK